jgi:hypothetical protein
MEDGSFIIDKTNNELTELDMVRLTPDNLREIEALGWVSVDERLPEDGFHPLEDSDAPRYLVVRVSPYSNKPVVMETYLFDYGFAVKGVTHWRPLPAPPKGVSNE